MVYHPNFAEAIGFPLLVVSYEIDSVRLVNPFINWRLPLDPERVDIDAMKLRHPPGSMLVMLSPVQQN